MESRWREQYYRVKRWHVRLAEAEAVDERHLDDLYAFFVCCFHLKDWLKADPTLDPAVGGAAEGLVNGNEWLALCADLANGSKHLVLTKQVRVESRLHLDWIELTLFDPSSPSDEEDPVVPMVRAVPVVRRFEGEVVARALSVADLCVQVWDSFLAERRLLGDPPSD